MTFLAPWAFVAGVIAAGALLALHLVARQRPAAYPLPTARFVPDRRTLVSRVSSRPRDILLLLLRLLLVLSAAAAFARPVLTPHRDARARVLMLDRSPAVADPADALRRAREILADGVPTRVVVFDSASETLAAGAAGLDSLSRSSDSGAKVAGSLSAALAAARRLGADVGAGADSVELVLVSALTEREVDAATARVRALWPGGVRLVRLTPASDMMTPPALERAVEIDDVLGPALAARRVRATSNGDVGSDEPSAARVVQIARGAVRPVDSAFARTGGVVVQWDSIGARRPAPSAIVMGDDVVVADLARVSLPGTGAVLARWADGSPAAVEQRLGAGCVREVGIGVPLAGDLPLSPAFMRIVNGLTDSCVGTRGEVGAPLDSARLSALAGPTGAASGAALAAGSERHTPIASWLLGVALACALAELLLRRAGGAREEK